MEACQTLLGRIKYFVGTCRGRQVFVDADGCVCSTNIRAFRRTENTACFAQIAKWLAANDQVVLFTCHHEVAIVKRGLDRDYDPDEVERAWISNLAVDSVRILKTFQGPPLAMLLLNTRHNRSNCIYLFRILSLNM